MKMHHFVTNGVVGYISLGNEPRTSLMVWMCTHCGSTKNNLKCHKSDPFTGLFPLMWLETRLIPLPVPIPNISTKNEYIRELEFNWKGLLPVMYECHAEFSSPSDFTCQSITTVQSFIEDRLLLRPWDSFLHRFFSLSSTKTIACVIIFWLNKNLISGRFFFYQQTDFNIHKNICIPF